MILKTMAGVHLHMSNRLERLADRLAELLSEPLSSPFDKEVIVVQSRGMERWLRMELAVRHGISANLDFPFPNAFLKRIYSEIIRDHPFDDEYEKESMVWRVMDILPECMREPEFRDIKHYLDRCATDVSLYQLSKYITTCFDQYLVFRPDMIIRWEQGHGRHWQAILWRRLTGLGQPIHKARARDILLRAIEAGRKPGSGVPKRVSIFGISSLPPYHIEIMVAISRFIDVHFFVMNPCKEYWFDIVTERKLDSVIRESGADYKLPGRLHLEIGNALLASMGRVGRDFLSLLLDLDTEEHTYFEDPEAETMLTTIQSDILNLRESASELGRPVEVREGDSSISVHSCHSPLREMEVLYDKLLDIFNKNPDIAPKDVVVMAPDIRQYAPFIEAVFGKRPGGPKTIPYSIADRGYSNSGQLVPALFHLFDFVNSRFTVSAVLSFLDREPVKRRFALSDKDLMTIRKWANDVRIHWGIDEAMKKELGLPPTKQNTWKAGIERLLLGFALPGQDKTLFKEILPYDHVEGEDALLLGKFVSFLRKITQAASLFATPAPVETWCERLVDVVEQMFCPGETTQSEYQTLLDIIADLRFAARKAGFKAEISFRVVKAHLETKIDEAGLAGGFLSKGVTFCSILPMRSIPFKVVCLIGMNHDAYPRRSMELAFDLMAARPRRGDRSRRNDDRYLFLEAILSARQYLIITYVGQSKTDNTTIPPSALVSELLDYIERNFVWKGGELKDRIFTKHRLWAFNSSYFEPKSTLFTYFDENLESARLCVKPKEGLRSFFKEDLPILPEDVEEISIDNLEGFLTNPAKFLLQKRLKIRFRFDSPLPPDQEPALLKGLEAYNLDQRLLKAKLSGVSLEGLYPVLKAEGLLPHGNVGAVEYERRSMEIDKFSNLIQGLIGDSRAHWMDVDVKVNGHRLWGRVGEIYERGLIHYRFGELRAQDYLRLWLYHLLINAIAESTTTLQSFLCGKDSQWRYKAVENAEEHLGRLIDLYVEGLKRPIKFFPESSFLFAIKLAKNGQSAAQALQSAKRVWEGSRYNRGEKEDDYFRLCFGDQDPLDGEFAEIAIEVFFPLLAHREKI